MSFSATREANLYDLQRLWQEELQHKNVSVSISKDDTKQVTDMGLGTPEKGGEPEEKVEAEMKADQGRNSEYDEIGQKQWKYRLKSRYESEYKLYQKLCRHQEVEPWMRRLLWLRACGLIPGTLEYLKDEKHYQFLLKQKMTCPGCKDLNNDHVPTFGAAKHWSRWSGPNFLSKHGQDSWKRVLLALEKECFVPYCPLLPNLICLLLLFVNEFEAFYICRYMVNESQARLHRWDFETISTGYDTFFYFPTDSDGWNAVEYSLLACLDKLAPNGLKNLEAVKLNNGNSNSILVDTNPETTKEDIDVCFAEKDGMHFNACVSSETKGNEEFGGEGKEYNDVLTEYITSCFHGVFINVVPLRHVIRILDCFIMEGFIVLIQVAVSILKKYGNGHNDNVVEYFLRNFLRDRCQFKTEFSEDMIRVESDLENEYGSSESDEKIEDKTVESNAPGVIGYAKDSSSDAENIPSSNFRSRKFLSFRRSSKIPDSTAAEVTKKRRRRSMFESMRPFSFRENKSEDSIDPSSSPSPKSSTSERSWRSLPRIPSLAKSFRSVRSRSSSLSSNTGMDAWVLRDTRENNIIMDDIAFDEIMRSIFFGKLRHLKTRYVLNAEEEYNYQRAVNRLQQTHKNCLGDSKYMGPRMVTNDFYNRLSAIHRRISISVHFPQEILSESDILTSAKQISTLLSWLPEKEKMKCSHLRLVYNPRNHGFGLDQLYLRCSDRTNGACILLVEDFQGSVFGVFCSDTFRLSKEIIGANVVGDETCFVFRLFPAESAKVWKFQKEQLIASGKLDWIGNDQFARCAKDSLSFGKVATGLTRGNRNELLGPALWLNEDISQGHSGRTITFGNEPLCTAEGPGHNEARHVYFPVKTVEVLTLPRL